MKSGAGRLFLDETPIRDISDLQSVPPLSFDLHYLDPPPPSTFFDKIFGEPWRHKYRLMQPNGDYWIFTGEADTGKPYLADEDEFGPAGIRLPASVDNIEIIEVGNIYDREGSD